MPGGQVKAGVEVEVQEEAIESKQRNEAIDN
jgi:hypothetical protein